MPAPDRAVCKGLAGANRGGRWRWKRGGRCPGSQRQLPRAPREGAPGSPRLGHYELLGDLPRYEGPGSPPALAKSQSGRWKNDSLEFPCGSGRLLKVAGACKLSVTVAGGTPQLSGHSSGTQTDSLWSRVFCSWVRPRQPLPERLWSQGWAFKRDPRTDR